ncbi:MAG TPA: hypothetical protein VFW19_08290 [Allosphingosinicella sp.]|nr:hypothetical protein [Allosphingosinicella sp.]
MPTAAKQRLLGAVDLTHFDTPSLRRGILLQALKRNPGQTGFEPISRSAREARELGLLICSRFEDYQEATKRAVATGCEKAGVPFIGFEVSEKEFVRSRYAPGLILDFPSFAFRIGEYRVMGRCCLTVCFNNSASKIWARIVLSQAGGNIPAMVSFAEARRYFRSGSAICKSLIANTRRLYLRDFKDSLGAEPGTHVRFKRKGDLTFLGIDEPLEVIEAAIDGAKQRGRRTAARETNELKDKLASLVNVLVENVAAPSDNNYSRPGGKTGVHVYEPDTGPTGMYLSKIATDSVTLAVASAQSDSTRRDSFRPSSSLAVTKDMASRLAARF